MSETINYKLYITDSDSVKFSVWRKKMNGETDSNMVKIDTALGQKADKSSAVPPTRKVNNKALREDITLSAADVGAAEVGHSHSATDVGAVPDTRKVNNKALNEDVILSASDVGALASGETAVAAVKLETARTIKTKLDSGSTASFDGTADITPGVTGTLPVANGGTGVTSLDSLKTLLGVGSGDNYAPKTDPVFNASISLGRKSGTEIGPSSVAIGAMVEASGGYSFATGYDSTASGEYSHAEGHGSTASGHASHAEGINTRALGESSHAEGSTTQASGRDSHAEGTMTTAPGESSHAEGSYTTADNFSSHVGGHYNKALTAGGTYANVTGDVVVIGNGAGSNRRSNCFRVTYAGEVYGLSSFKTSGADYAEYFEWADGNSEKEDRVGYFVTMDGKHIRFAHSGEYILGVVSAQPCIIGNADEDWLGRWEHDEYGRFMKEHLEETETGISMEGLTEEAIDTLRRDPEVKERDGKFYRTTAKVVDHETPSWRYKANPN